MGRKKKTINEETPEAQIDGSKRMLEESHEKKVNELRAIINVLEKTIVRLSVEKTLNS